MEVQKFPLKPSNIFSKLFVPLYFNLKLLAYVILLLSKDVVKSIKVECHDHRDINKISIGARKGKLFIVTTLAILNCKTCINYADDGKI